MSDFFRTPEDYELFLYTLVERFSEINRSTQVTPEKELLAD
jgi:hypothetical protein